MGKPIRLAQESFFDLVCDQLIELGELGNKEYTYLEDTIHEDRSESMGGAVDSTTLVKLY